MAQLKNGEVALRQANGKLGLGVSYEITLSSEEWQELQSRANISNRDGRLRSAAEIFDVVFDDGEEVVVVVTPTATTDDTMVVDQGGFTETVNGDPDGGVIDNDSGVNLRNVRLVSQPPNALVLIDPDDGSISVNHDGANDNDFSISYLVDGDNGTDVVGTVDVTVNTAALNPANPWKRAWAWHNQSSVNGFTFDLPNEVNHAYNDAQTTSGSGAEAGDLIVVTMHISGGGDAFSANAAGYTLVHEANPVADYGEKIYTRIATGDANDAFVEPAWTDGGFVGLSIMTFPSGYTLESFQVNNANPLLWSSQHAHQHRNHECLI